MKKLYKVSVNVETGGYMYISANDSDEANDIAQDLLDDYGLTEDVKEYEDTRVPRVDITNNETFVFEIEEA